MFAPLFVHKMPVYFSYVIGLHKIWMNSDIVTRTKSMVIDKVRERIRLRVRCMYLFYLYIMSDISKYLRLPTALSTGNDFCLKGNNLFRRIDNGFMRW